MRKVAEFAARVGGLILDAINRSNKKKMSDNAANTIANSDDRVQQSEIKYTDLASESQSDTVK